MKTILYLVLFVTTTVAFGQDPPLTGTLKVVGINLVRVSAKIPVGPLGTIDTTQDTFAGAFSVTDLSQTVKTEGQPSTTIGPCIFQPLGQSANQTGGNDPTTYLDAGPFLNVTGPNGSKQIPQAKLLYGANLGGGVAIPGLPTPPPLFLSPGDYTVDNGGGGADVGPFTASITIPTLFQWTNADPSPSIDRAAGFDVTWTGGNPDTKVFIGGSVPVIDAVTRRISGGGVFTCIEDNSAGHFFIPAELLTLLPPSVTTGGVPNGSLLVTNGVTAKFDLPGFYQSQLNWSLGVSRIVEVK